MSDFLINFGLPIGIFLLFIFLILVSIWSLGFVLIAIGSKPRKDKIKATLFSMGILVGSFYLLKFVMLYWLVNSNNNFGYKIVGILFVIIILAYLYFTRRNKGKFKSNPVTTDENNNYNKNE
jgi:hypothetical protein